MELLKRRIDQDNHPEQVPASITAQLQIRRRNDNLRRLPQPKEGLIDFSSNDYLGFSTTGVLKQRIDTLSKNTLKKKVGSTGSRLLTGNDGFEPLEEQIAIFHGVPAALIFNSGYDANVGLLSSVPTRHDTVIYDELVHVSLRDGIRLSSAKKKYNFRHNDLEDLRSKIRNAAGQIFIVVESVYSMDGDFAPLLEVSAIAQEIGAYLIIDEAHAVGVFGENGRGRVSELGLEKSVFATIFTFGKALGCHGAVVAGSSELKEYLINFAHSFIYTTALDHQARLAITAAYDLLEEKETSPSSLFLLIAEFRKLSRQFFPDIIRPTYSPIQTILIPSNEKVKRVSADLLSHKLDVKPILHPTVPQGTERLRLSLHAFNGPEEVHHLLHTLRDIV